MNDLSKAIEDLPVLQDKKPIPSGAAIDVCAGSPDLPAGRYQKGPDGMWTRVGDPVASTEDIPDGGTGVACYLTLQKNDPAEVALMLAAFGGSQ